VIMGKEDRAGNDSNELVLLGGQHRKGW
jgi:hypothetical protein